MFVADLFLPTRRRSNINEGGPFTNLGYCSAVEKLINFINDTCINSLVNASHNHFRQSLIERRAKENE